MRGKLVAGLCGGVLMGLGGCGGDDGDEKSSGSKSDESPKTTAAKAPSHAAVLKCLQDADLEAKDQSSSSGNTIGIDYPAGRAVISFQKTAEEAATYASVAKTNGETAVAKGTVAITIPVDAEAQTAQSTIEGCVDSP